MVHKHKSHGFSLLQKAAYTGKSDAFKILIDVLPHEHRRSHFYEKSPLQLDLAGTLVGGFLRSKEFSKSAVREIMKVMLEVDSECFEACLVFLARKASTKDTREFEIMKVVLEQAQVRTLEPMLIAIDSQSEAVKSDSNFISNLTFCSH